MSSGDYTAAPESAEERELRCDNCDQPIGSSPCGLSHAAILLSAIRREVGAGESRCVSQYRGRAGIGPVCGLTVEEHCPIELPSPDGHGCSKWHHAFQPESTLAAVQRLVRRVALAHGLIDQISNGNTEVMRLAPMPESFAAHAITHVEREREAIAIYEQARGTAKPEEG